MQAVHTQIYKYVYIHTYSMHIKRVKGFSLLVVTHCMFLFMLCVCGYVCVHAYMRVCSSPALAVGVSVIISTSVAMETISVTLIGFITRRVGTC